MAARRRVAPPSVVYSSRTSVEREHCAVVDALLKRLKATSRRLQAALASHRTELQVLERLYYKGKNQHRTALFWQRVAEMRKFGERMDEMHMDDVVESLRLSFWGEPSARTAKLLKGPWTHCPDVKPLLFVLERCSACCTLIDRARERLVGAYESFTLMMQTGAFLQLVLVLAAIASRLSIVLSEIRAALEVTWSATYEAMQTLFPLETKKVKALVKTAEAAAPVPIVLPESMAASAVHTPGEVHDEDLGSALARPSRMISEGRSVSANATPPAPDQEVLDVATFSLSSEPQLHRTVEQRTLQPVITKVPTVTPAVPTTSVSKRKKVDSEASTKPVKKNRKKRDEIDDIFGF